jgi:hypothetical protein
MVWRSFEQRVRDLAALNFNRPVSKRTINGVNLDAFVDISEHECALIEITTERNLDKIRTDVNRLVLVKRNLEEKEHKFCRVYIVMEKEPTSGMIEAGSAYGIKVVSSLQFERSFFDYRSYANARHSLAFGSAVNPLTGEPDKTEFIPVSYIFEKPEADDGVDRLARLLQNGRKIVLLGEFGSGKSRCIKEVFSRLSTADQPESYFLAIDLRTTWGLQSSDEIIRRHMAKIGLSGETDKIIRAFNQGHVGVLLDGFDEVAAQSWSAGGKDVKDARRDSLMGVRDLISHTKGGVFISGREHYFNTEAELMGCLGLKGDDAQIVRCKSEFTEEEMQIFLDKLSEGIVMPEWLPRRPLMCQALASLNDVEVERIFGGDDGDVEFWKKFVKVICERESRINASLDANTIAAVLTCLARTTRSKSGDVGPISYGEIEAAFRKVVGRDPVDAASVMLQRLPGLGRTDADSNDRRFIDKYILDGLRAEDLFDGIKSADMTAVGEKWLNGLETLGQRIAASSIREANLVKSALNYAEKCQSDGNGVIAADVASALVLLDPADQAGLNIYVREGTFTSLDLTAVAVKRLDINDSIIQRLIFPATPENNISISNSTVSEAEGVTSKQGLPSWVVDCTVGKYQDASTVKQIRGIKLKDAHKILVTILRKIFFQRGAGRQEDALLRGLGQIDSGGQSRKILNKLLEEGLIKTFPGDHGPVYAKVVAAQPRVGRMLAELNMSSDPLWVWAGSL